MSGTLAVAIIALVFSGVSSVVAVVALRYSRRADRRAESQEARETARFERELDEDVAWMTVEEIRGPRGSERGRDYTVVLTNLGPAPAHRLAVWFQDIAEREIGKRAGGRAVLMPGETREFELTVPAGTEPRESIHVYYEWTDGTGRNKTGSSADVPWP